jgi:hypothetical protein
MAEVNLKTEIGILDGTPEKRLFWSIISDYDLKTALTELVDNALDLWLSTKNRSPLSVQVNVDSDRQIITLIDNAGGVRHEDIRLLITPGGSNNSPDATAIGIFGVGSKRAVVAVAEHVRIKTRHHDDQSFQIDIEKEWLESDGWDLPLYEIPEIVPGTTMIELTQLRRKLVDTDAAALLSHFGETYAWFLQQSGCAITVNGVCAEPKAFDAWAYPPDYLPQRVEFETWPDGSGSLKIELIAGLIRDRDPAMENYGVYFYCNNRLIVKDLKAREVGYFVTSEAGVPHPDASLCRAIVRLNGPAKLMPWNSSKNGINFDHPAFGHLRKTLIQLVAHFSSLSRRLKDDWEGKVFPHVNGTAQIIPPETAIKQGKLILPTLPRVNKPRSEKLKAKNKDQIQDQPWTLGLVEAMAAVDIVTRQKLQTRTRIALILLDSNFEIGLKEFIVHRIDLFSPTIYTDAKIKQVFLNRDKVIQEVNSKVPLDPTLLKRAKHFYALRNKLIHERATVSIPDDDIDNYRAVIQKILTKLFQLEF